MLQRSSQIGPVLFHKLRILFQVVPQKIEKRGFQSAERIIKSVQPGFAEGEPQRVPFPGQPVHMGPARVRQIQELGAFVKSFSCRIVYGPAHNFHDIIVTDQDQLGMSPGHQQAEEREAGGYSIRCAGLNEMHQDVCLEMVHFDQGDTQGSCKTLCKGSPHQQRAQKSRPSGKCYRINFIS